MNNNKMEQISKLILTRKTDLDQPVPFIKEDEKAIFKKNREDILFLDENRNTPLKMVLMGEVKAGKSTLLNAFVGQYIAPVGVTETTAVIMEILYAPEESGYIHYTDGTVENYTINELYQILEKNKDDVSFTSRIEKSRVTYPLNSLKNIHIVDTPGVETITQENHNTTINFIQQSDVVLWVLSTHHLGQSDIDQQILEVMNYGKPIILLVNRIDQIDQDDIPDVMEFIDDNYGHYIEKSFPVSGKLAFDAKLSKDNKLLEQSGLPEILAYLNDNINHRADDVKEDSLISSYEQILYKELHNSKAIMETILFIEHAISERKKDIDYFKNKAKSSLQKNSQLWVKNNLLREEEDYVYAEVNKSSKSLLKDNSAQVQKIIKEYTSEQYVNSIVQAKCNELSHYVEEELERALETIGSKFIEEETEYKEKYEFQVNLARSFDSHYQIDSRSEELVEGAKKGAVVGGAYGVAAATYAAVLGPYAAGIGIASAVGAVLPPVLLIGAVTGAAFKYVNKGKKTTDLKNLVKLQFDYVRDTVAAELEEYIEALNIQINSIMDDTYKNLGEMIIGDVDIEEFTKFKSSLSLYINELEQIKDSSIKLIEKT